jgi:hypothetical protein
MAVQAKLSQGSLLALKMESIPGGILLYVDYVESKSIRDLPL